MTATDNQGVTHGGTRPTQAAFVPAAVQWSGHVQVWPHSVTSPTPAGAAPCALTQMLIELLKPAVEAQTKAPLASPQAPRAPVQASCSSMLPQTGLARRSSGEVQLCLSGPCACPTSACSSSLGHCEVTAITTLLRNVHRIMCYVHMHPLPTNR